MAAIPTTELDSWFSDPDTTATSREVTRDVLENAELFWVTTVRENGRPHATPLVAVWLDDALHFCTGATEQKGVNLRTENHVVLMTGYRWGRRYRRGRGGRRCQGRRRRSSVTARCRMEDVMGRSTGVRSRPRWVLHRERWRTRRARRCAFQGARIRQATIHAHQSSFRRDRENHERGSSA